jgi:peptidoglycan/LPS O-acetylase OafA/YrhL
MLSGTSTEKPLLRVAHRLGRQYSASSSLSNFALVSLTTIALAALSRQLFELPIDDRRAELAAASPELSAAAPH